MLRLTCWLPVCVFQVWGFWVLVGLEVVLNEICWLRLFPVFWPVANMYLMVLKSELLLFTPILVLELATTGGTTGALVCTFIPEKKSICGWLVILDLLVYYSLLKKSTYWLSMTTDDFWGFIFIVWNINCIVLNYSEALVGCVCWTTGACCSYYSKSKIFWVDFFVWIDDYYNKLFDILEVCLYDYYTLELDVVDTDWP